MTSLGQRIIDGLRDAVVGDFARVTIEGETWVRLDRAHVIVPRVATEKMIAESRVHHGAPYVSQRQWEAMLTAVDQ